MSGRPMGLKRWRKLREDIADAFENALDYVDSLDGVPFSDKRNAAVKARDAVLKSLYEADAIEPPKGTTRSHWRIET